VTPGGKNGPSLAPASWVLLYLIIVCASASGQYISADTYTRYELLAPETHQFKIYYEVTETRAGARFHFNPIREGSEASDESVIDLATGKSLKFEVVTGLQAKTDSPSENFSPTGHFIKVHLAHPVPERGEYRIAITKTYKDDKSYYSESDQIIFKRPLGIPRDSIVLPPGYEIVSCSVATQVLTESDGRLKLAFVNAGSGGQLEVTIRAKKLPEKKSKLEPPVVRNHLLAITRAGGHSRPPLQSPLRVGFVSVAQERKPAPTERAYQDREILYELQSPDSHAFRITHDYTVRTVGEKYYFNVVRAGSHVTDPESIDLDTGEKLKWEIISGKQATDRKLPITEAIKDDSEIVVTHLAGALAKGTTNRVRLMETYADPKSYYLDGEELVWDRTFGRLRNTVVLPQGWYLTTLLTPATIQTLPDGRVSIYVVNPRNDDVRVYFRARRRAPRT